MSSLEELHSKFNRDISLEELELHVRSNNSLKDEDDKLLSNAIDTIRSSDVGEDVLSDVLKSIRLRTLASELAITSLGVAEGSKSREDLDSLITRFREESEGNNSDVSDESEFVTDDLDFLYEQHYKKPGLRWRLHALNRSLGSLRKGDFGFIFARPETGKTTFLASEITYMAEQLKEDDGPILWLNNEEQGDKVKVRLFVSSCGVPTAELMSNRERFTHEYNERTKRKIKLKDNASLHRSDIERLCKQIKPSLIVIDQIDKIKGFAADREDLRLGAIYIWARELAKQYCPIIGVCQADGTGEGVRWLTMDHVSNAKTSKQAEADFILGIGKIHDPVYENVRFINISKNKLQGDEDSEPKQRHARIQCLIEPEIQRYTDIV